VGEDITKARALIDQLRHDLTERPPKGKLEDSRQPVKRVGQQRKTRPKSGGSIGGTDGHQTVTPKAEKTTAATTPSPKNHVLILNDHGEWQARSTKSQRITCKNMKLVGDRWIGNSSNLEVIDFPEDPWPVHDTGKSFAPISSEFGIDPDELFTSQNEHEEFMTGAWLQQEKHPERFLRDGLRQMGIIKIVQAAHYQKHLRNEHNLLSSGQTSPESEGSDAGEDSLDDTGPVDDHSEWANEIDFGKLGSFGNGQKVESVQEDNGDEAEVWDM